VRREANAAVTDDFRRNSCWIFHVSSATKGALSPCEWTSMKPGATTWFVTSTTVHPRWSSTTGRTSSIRPSRM
jgi:hypothetical protein